MSRTLLFPMIMVGGLALAAAATFSSPQASSAQAAAPSPAAVAEAKQTFATLCGTCHGANGKGDGVASASLTPKPRDFSSSEWQKSATDAQIEKVIVEGGPSIGKSPIMPGSPQFKSKPEVVAALRSMIRSFAAK